MRKTISFPSCGATSCRTLVAGKQPTPPHAFARGERTIPLPGSSWVHCLTAAPAPPPPPSLYHRHQKDSLSPGSRERSKASCQPAWLTDLVSRWKQVLSEGRVREGEGGFMVCTGTIMEEGVKRGGGLRWGVVSFFIVKAFSRKTSRTFGYMLRGWNNSTFSYFSQANI